jgi:hypothetical protein
MTLRLSTDRKTANLSTANGKQAKIKNAFGMASGREFSCPGATAVCEKVCYAGKLEKLFPAMRAMMIANFESVIALCESPRELRAELRAMIAGFVAECEKWNAEKAFRIHHDGDFLNRTYAQAWADVIREFPDVQFWVYTRSFTPGINVIDLIADIPNLTVYISVDMVNHIHAGTIIDEFPSVKIAALAQTMENAGDIVKGVLNGTRPGAMCPENIGRIPLITENGGACFSCGLCVKGKADVRFAIGKA